MHASYCRTKNGHDARRVKKVLVLQPAVHDDDWAEVEASWPLDFAVNCSADHSCWKTEMFHMH